jgi:hypothetical protein
MLWAPQNSSTGLIDCFTRTAQFWSQNALKLQMCTAQNIDSAEFPASTCYNWFANKYTQLFMQDGATKSEHYLGHPPRHLWLMRNFRSVSCQPRKVWSPTAQAFIPVTPLLGDSWMKNCCQKSQSHWWSTGPWSWDCWEIIDGMLLCDHEHTRSSFRSCTTEQQPHRTCTPLRSSWCLFIYAHLYRYVTITASMQSLNWESFHVPSCAPE